MTENNTHNRLPDDRRNCPECGGTLHEECIACRAGRTEGHTKESAESAARRFAIETENLEARLAEAIAENMALRQALTASDETKAVYMGEFSFQIDAVDEDGDAYGHWVKVPWTTIKEIMAKIAHYAGVEPIPTDNGSWPR